MPARPTRRRAEPHAGPTITDDRATPAATTAAAVPAARGPRPTRKFTALIDAETEARYAQLLTDVRQHLGPIATRGDGAGATRAGYDISRADLLRALLAVAQDDPAVTTAVETRLRSHYG